MVRFGKYDCSVLSISSKHKHTIYLSNKNECTAEVPPYSKTEGGDHVTHKEAPNTGLTNSTHKTVKKVMYRTLKRGDALFPKRHIRPHTKNLRREVCSSVTNCLEPEVDYGEVSTRIETALPVYAYVRHCRRDSYPLDLPITSDKAKREENKIKSS
jgi:hypothetical protein